MKRVLFGGLWAVLCVAAGIAGMLALASLALHHRMRLEPHMVRLGAEVGLDVFAILLCFGRLPGARRPLGGGEESFGPWQAVAGVAGFGVMMIAGGVAVYNLLFVEDLLLHMLHFQRQVDFTKIEVLVVTAVVGELSAALWISWYLRGLGEARLTDGSPAGIGWRRPEAGGYRAAAFAAAVIIGLVMVLYHFVPPDMQALQDLPDAKLFQGPGWTLAPVLMLAVFLAPVLEEFVFRGVGFAGIAARLGPVWAGGITTVLFMAVHAPEKIHYPAGFVDVGLMAAAACWLRVRYGSIRPGILLHVVYNGGLMVAAGLVH
jgi:membrane protease YdiL (CAAX protease family)